MTLVGVRCAKCKTELSYELTGYPNMRQRIDVALIAAEHDHARLCPEALERFEEKK